MSTLQFMIFNSLFLPSDVRQWICKPEFGIRIPRQARQPYIVIARKGTVYFSYYQRA
jgi:hypothetical protein